MKREFFGTDGIRGRVGIYPITPDFVMKLGWAVGKVLSKEHSNGTALIGKDTRISGYMFESALYAGLTAAGMKVRLLGPMPTPGVAYLTSIFGDVGIVISASHNSFEDNGLKFFSKNGFKLPDAVEYEVEEQMKQPLTTVNSAVLGKASRITDAAGRYIEYCKSTLSKGDNLEGLKIVIDCAHGATYRIAPSVFQELGAKVVVLNDKPDGLNINHECGSTAPEFLCSAVLKEKADLGVAFDGDGDRLIMVDHTGEVVDGDELLFIIAKERHLRETLKGGVVGTHMSNMGLELGLRHLGIEFLRTKVGDRYVIELLRKSNWSLGGEPSGHLVCLDMCTTGDGIIAALQVLAAIKRQEKSLFILRQEMIKFPQTLINVPSKQPHHLAEHPHIQRTTAKIVKRLAGKGRVLLRPSGTEPYIRIMIEGENQDTISQYGEELAEIVRSVCVV